MHSNNSNTANKHERSLGEANTKIQFDFNKNVKSAKLKCD